MAAMAAMATMPMALDGTAAGGSVRDAARRLSSGRAMAGVRCSSRAVCGGRGARMESPRAGKTLDYLGLCEAVERKSCVGIAREEGIWSRIVRAWRILFPAGQSLSNAQVAKKRLKMILISDRCSVTDEAKRKIVDNIVGALADFVEIESEESVELNVSSDVELGTLYYVTVPVRRVRPQYQDCSKDTEIPPVLATDP